MPDKIRVLFAMGTLSGGGSERQIIGILRHIDRSRFVPLLYLASRQGELLSEVPSDVPIFAFWDRHTYPRLNFPGRIHRLQARDMARVIREQFVDIVYDRTFHMTLMSAAATQLARVPRISVVVADPHQDVPTNAGRFVGFKKWLLRKAYLRANRVTAVSEGIRRSTLDYYRLPAKCVTTVYNFVDQDRVEQLSREQPANWSPDRFHIVAAGRLHEEKGHRFLLQAMDVLVHRCGMRQLMLHLLGQGPLEAEFKAFVSERRLQDHVEFVGYCRNPFPFFRHAQLFCLPSLHEGMSNALLEAMLCEVPVLATSNPDGPDEILCSVKYGRFVPPGDARALVYAIKDAVGHHDQWRRKTSAAKAYIEQTFSAAAGMARIEELLAKVVAENRHRR